MSSPANDDIRRILDEASAASAAAVEARIAYARWDARWSTLTHRETAAEMDRAVSEERAAWDTVSAISDQAEEVR